MKFDWDEAKNNANQRKHNISFQKAYPAFLDPYGIILADPSHSIEEERSLLLGFNNKHLVVISFTKRGDFIRIISCRKATRKERRVYERNRHATR